MANGTPDLHSGPNLDDFLEEEGHRDEVESVAIKRALAWQFEQKMTRQHMTKKAMAAELKTSRSQLDRLLDPQNTAVSLYTWSRTANVLGKRLVLEIRDVRPQALRAKRAGQRRSRVAAGTAAGQGKNKSQSACPPAVLRQRPEAARAG